MEILNSGPIARALAHKAGRGANGAQIGEAIVSTWQDIEAALRPIIGKGGVDALYKRSLYLTVPTHAWLAVSYEENRMAPDVTSLRFIIAQQDPEEAISAGAALLQTFNDLLGSFIGASLAERLLRPVWENLLDRPPVTGAAS